VRIKILNKNGFDYGNVGVPYYAHEKSEQFYLLKAAIYQPDGSSAKLTKKDVFTEEYNKYWSQARFAFPQVSEGAIIEYTYAINSNRFYEPEDWFFQREIPVRHSELRIVYPAELEYTYFFQGNEGMKKIKDETNLTILEGRNGRCTIKPSVFVFENAPAMKQESYITTMDDYRARLRFQLSKIKYRDGRVNRISTSWRELKEELEHSSSFGFHYLK
jgi:hypothetical protein